MSAAEAKRWLRILGNELDRRRYKTRLLENYFEGNHPVPEHVRKVKLEPEYKVLMRQATSNWPSLIIRAPEERLEPTGIRINDDTDAQAWEIWQRNYLDADSSLVHTGSLVVARSFVSLWADPDESDDKALITPEHASNTIVAYRDGSRRRRAAALRRWVSDDETWHATVYLPDALYKFDGPKSTEPPSLDTWVPRIVTDEEWPLKNPLGVVPIVEFSSNRSIRPGGRCGRARGEFEDVLPIIDRINTTVFAGLLAQAYASFPVRALIGDQIRYAQNADGTPKLDDNGQKIPIPPFNNIAVDRFLQIENPEGKLIQLPESNLDNYIKYAEAHVRHLAAITQTPPQYLLGELVNLSADALKAAESNLVSKVRVHMKVFGEAWEDVLRIALAIEGREIKRSDATLLWRNPEIRSEAQLADATLKLKDVLPWRMQMEYLGYSDQDIKRAEQLRAGDVFAKLLELPPPGEPTATPAIDVASAVA